MKKAYLLLLLMILFAFNSFSQKKQMIDFFRPMEPQTPLISENIWGEVNVLPRDTANGLEDPMLKKWCFWDGMISKGGDGKYYMYGSAWSQSVCHHVGWTQASKAITAVSDNPMGPYRNVKIAWPQWNNGKGHNVMGLRLFDGRYAMVTSEITRGEVFVSKNPDGPWKYVDTIKVDCNGYRLTSVKYPFNLHMSNVMIFPRPDGKYMIVPRQCVIMISDKIDGPYKIMGEPIYKNQPGLPDYQNEMLEDPTIWYSGGLYHILVNQHRYGIAHHFTSEDGIHNWKYRGVGFDTNKKIFRYTNGVLNNWYIVQRPIVFCENGHPTHFTFSVIDAHKGDDNGNDRHGSKVIVVPFDGVAFDKYMSEVVAEEKASERKLKREIPNASGDDNIFNSHYYGFEEVNGIKGASWHIQHPQCWSFSDEKSYKGKYSLKFVSGWPKDRFQRLMVHSCDYYNYSLARPTINAGKKVLSAEIFIESGNPESFAIDFMSDPYSKHVSFNTKGVTPGKWVKLETVVDFDKDFNDFDKSIQISVLRVAPKSVFYLDDIRLEPIYLSNTNLLNKDYYGFEYPNDSNKKGFLAHWQTNSGYNITPETDFITREPYYVEPTLFIVTDKDKNEKIKPYSGHQCLKFKFENICMYQSTWMRSLCTKYGSPSNDLWVKPGKFSYISKFNNTTF